MNKKKIILHGFKYVVCGIIASQLISVANSLINAKSDFSNILGVLIYCIIIAVFYVIITKDANRIHQFIFVKFLEQQHDTTTPSVSANIPVTSEKVTEQKKKKSPGRPRKKNK